MIVGDRLINNSGVLLEYRGKVIKLNGELRPLLTLRFSPSLNLAGHTVGLTSLYGRAHYRLPTYSEDLVTYDFSPYIRGKFERFLPVTYNLTVGYSGKEYPLTPMKSYTLYRALGDVSLSFSTAQVVHHLKVEGRLNRYNYVGLTAEEEVPVGVEERSKFEYVPTFMGIFRLVMSVNRTLNVYSGVLKDRSQVYRNILIEGNVETGNTGVYLRRRREDHVFLHRSRSSNTRTLLRYVLGVSRAVGNLRFDWEVSAIYTLYRFRSAENSLYRYFDNAVSYGGRSEFFLRIRMWDRGRYVIGGRCGRGSQLRYKAGRTGGRCDVQIPGWRGYGHEEVRERPPLLADIHEVLKNFLDELTSRRASPLEYLLYERRKGNF